MAWAAMWRGGCLAVMGLSAIAAAADPLPLTQRDFLVPGTQVGDVDASTFFPPQLCSACHSHTPNDSAPYDSWRGSLMAQAGRDPLFFAQMTTANQDVANVGSYCLRCHVPMAVVSGSVATPDGSALGNRDKDGVDCHFCHAMVDPVYKPGLSPPQDQAILAALDQVPAHAGNAMFVLDPEGLRRGPRSDALPPHSLATSPYHRSAALCGSCHDVGNVAVSRQGDGTYRYNALDTPAPTADPAQHFPLERTYSEWRLSAFASGGVDMGGRFGGDGGGVVSTCQDCHMPVRGGQACTSGPDRPDLRSHDFAGASSWVLDIIGRYNAGDPAVDPAAIATGMARANDMLGRAASLELMQQPGGVLRARVINESGHKLPTGHIEGRRAWVEVRVLDAASNVLRTYGGYDAATAELDEDSTVVYEMAVGLSPAAAALTGHPVGRTTHMALADTVVKDSRIPPRGFVNAAFAAAGAPTVGRDYADGQYWDDVRFWLPQGAAQVQVAVHYQTATRHYIEALRDANVTDHWGDTLHDLWEQSGRSPPVTMASGNLAIGDFLRGDFNGNGALDQADADRLAACIGAGAAGIEACLAGDFNGDRRVDCSDAQAFAAAWPGPGAAPLPPVCVAGAARAVPASSDWGLALLGALLLLVGAGALQLSLRRRRRV